MSSANQYLKRLAITMVILGACILIGNLVITKVGETISVPNFLLGAIVGLFAGMTSDWRTGDTQ